MRTVVPLVGTWIETPELVIEIPDGLVVPLVGTWIETGDCYALHDTVADVVPLVGTWIETKMLMINS